MITAMIFAISIMSFITLLAVLANTSKPTASGAYDPFYGGGGSRDH